MGKSFFLNFLRDRGGSLTVEFVVLTPLLLAALVFSFEFGKAFWAYDTVTRDVRAGVRYLSRISTTCATDARNNVNVSYAGTSVPLQTAVANLVKTGAISPAGTNHFPWSNSATFSYPTARTYAVPTYNLNGEVVGMTASVPVTLTFLDALNRFAKLTGGSALSTSYTLSVSYEARCIGN